MRDRTWTWPSLVALAAAALAISLLALAGCTPPAEEEAPTFVPPATRPPTPPASHTVSRGSIEESVQTRGSVEARRQERLMFRLDGRLEAIHVAAGEQVEEGALLAELYAEDLQEQVSEAEYQLEGAKLTLEDAKLAQENAERALQMQELQQEKSQAQMADDDVLAAEIELEKARVQLEGAEKELQKALERPWESDETIESYRWTLQLSQWNYQMAEEAMEQARRERYSESIDRKLLEIQMEQAQQNVEQAKRGVERAKRGVERAEAAVTKAEEKLSQTELRAPFPGVVVSMNKAVGDQVASFEAIGMMADPAELQVIAMVLQEEAARIAVGAQAQVQLDPYPNQTFTATVEQIADEPIVWQGKAAYEVGIAFQEGQDVPAAVDLGAVVEIAGRSRRNVLVIPDRAIITIGDRSYVEVLQDDGSVERVEIETGLSSGEQTEVTAGLQEGQQIVIP
jgi:macrolide-specific efflux system membrane fusion protein